MLFDKSMNHNESYIILFYTDYIGYLSPEGMLRGALSFLKQMGSFFHGEDKVYSYIKWAIMEEKPVLALAGNPGLHYFVSHNHYDLNQKQQARSV